MEQKFGEFGAQPAVTPSNAASEPAASNFAPKTSSNISSIPTQCLYSGKVVQDNPPPHHSQTSQYPASYTPATATSAAQPLPGTQPQQFRPTMDHSGGNNQYPAPSSQTNNNNYPNPSTYQQPIPPPTSNYPSAIPIQQLPMTSAQYSAQYNAAQSFGGIRNQGLGQGGALAGSAGYAPAPASQSGMRSYPLPPNVPYQGGLAAGPSSSSSQYSAYPQPPPQQQQFEMKTGSTFNQYSMANSRQQGGPPPVMDLSCYGIRQMGAEYPTPGPSSSSFGGGGGISESGVGQPMTMYQRIKTCLKTAQIFPKSEDVASNSQVKVPDQGSPSFCHIFYYEMNERVGEPYKSEGSQVTIDGLCAPSDGVRFCLGILGNVNRNPVTVSARRQIGKGCRIFRDSDDIYLECLSESPIFVQCPLYAEYNKDHLATVYRLPQDMKIKVFDKRTFDDLVTQATAQGYNAVYTLLAMCHIRISFVKGWGEQYRRQTITATPCWVEVQFPGPLQVLDKVLMTAGGPKDEETHSFS